MFHYERYTFMFPSQEEAIEGISKLNSVFCNSLNLCLSHSCFCVLNRGETFCNFIEINSKYKSIYINEGPDWSIIYVNIDTNIIVYFHYFANKVDNEFSILTTELTKFRRTEIKKPSLRSDE